MTAKYCLSICWILLVQSLTAQENPLFFDLEDLLELATTNTLELQEFNSLLKESGLQLALLDERQKPQLMVNATLPNLSRSIESRPLPDGRDAFVNRSTMYNTIGVEMAYELSRTGGTIYARSSLDRLDILKTSQLDYSRNYFYTPISIGINQPLFRFNEAKWEKERNELLYKELSAQQFLVREEVIGESLQKYSDAFQAQSRLDLAKQKVSETDTLYQIKQGLAEIGKATKAEMLRLELEKASNQQKLEEAQLEWETRKMELCDYLGLAYELLPGLNPPPNIQNIQIDPAMALDQALKNTYQSAQSHRRIREAETAIEKAEKDNGFLFDIQASLGLNNSSENLNKVLQNLENQQTVSLGIALPITGAKSRALKREIAREQLFREQTDLRQEQIDLIRAVTTHIKSYTMLNKSIELHKKAMTVTAEIFQLTRRQYLLGKLSITELNIAGAERDQALLQYQRSILSATLKYYEIRKLCLYDFAKNKSLLK